MRRDADLGDQGPCSLPVLWAARFERDSNRRRLCRGFLNPFGANRVLQILIGGGLLVAGLTMIVAGIQALRRNPSRSLRWTAMEILYSIVTDHPLLLVVPLILVFGGLLLIARGSGLI